MWFKTIVDPFVVILTIFFYGATLNNVNNVLVDTMVLYGDLTQEAMVAKFITFRTNEIYVFQIMAQIQISQKIRHV